jgi:glycerol-3-phosphate dehydrogenase
MKTDWPPANAGGSDKTMSSIQFDVIVIGAGINGAGIARDAALRGLKVLLLDKGDIGGGTSSWSTRLIHGGLRYLEHGEFGLVRESLREREYLLKIAPHLVRPLPLLAPIYKHARRGVWTIRAGMIAYDALSFDKTLPRHRMLSAAETLQRAPGLRGDDLLGAAIYFDAQVEYAERLVLENVLSAIEHGAVVMTYARVEKLIVADSKVRGIEFRRPGPGEVQGPQSKVQSRANIVINAAGPWVDQLLCESGGDSPRLIGGTKGSHLIVAPFPGAPDSAIYVEAETDHRPFFIIPWNNKYLIGTTDSRYEGDLDHVRIDDEEIDYLLRETNRVIPMAELTRQHILFTYSGVRPLPFTGDKDEESITRKHFIRADPRVENLFSIVGGKLTTYRSLAEQTVDLILKKLARSSIECATARESLPGASGEGSIRAARPGSPFEQPVLGGANDRGTVCDRWLRIYGTRASLIVDLLNEDASLAEVFDAETGAIAAEVVMAFKHELAQTLADCLLRRTMVGLNSSCGLNAVEAAARIAQRFLGWSDSRAAEEVDAYRSEINRRFRVRTRIQARSAITALPPDVR